MPNSLKIKDVMEKPVFVSPSSTKKELFMVARKNPKTRVFIVSDKSRKFIGDIHEDDLFLMLVPNELYSEIGVDIAFDLERKFFAKTAKELMRRHDYSCHEDDKLIDVALEFVRIEVNEMPVLDKSGKVVGIVTQGMLARHLEQK